MHCVVLISTQLLSFSPAQLGLLLIPLLATMTLFSITCPDYPDNVEKRLAVRAEHLAMGAESRKQGTQGMSTETMSELLKRVPLLSTACIRIVCLRRQCLDATARAIRLMLMLPAQSSAAPSSTPTPKPWRAQR